MPAQKTKSKLKKGGRTVNDLVFLEPNKIDAVPFTTSKVISQFSGVAHKKIKIDIRKYESKFKTLGLLAPYETESTGGRPEEIYRLNEPQASFLMTLLKNTPVVVAFKFELVKQFYAMRIELTRRQLLRQQLKPIRRELTDVINEVDPGRWSYKKYTNLAYKSAIGKNAAQLRKDRGAPKKSKAIDFMTSQEIEKVTHKQSQISVLCDMGLNYEQVKELVLNHMLLGNIGASVAISNRWDDS
jgi:phage regulator Rha-like protein